MGQAESSESSGVNPGNPNEHAEVEIDGSKLGYRVLDVEETGPAACCGLVLYLDFITHVNGVRMDTEDSTLIDLVTQNEGKALNLTVYNCKRKALREVSFVPRRDWGGVGLLGLMVRFDTFEEFDQSIIRVLKVYPGSPAEEAGLTPSVDYLLGTTEIVFLDLDDLFDIVKMSTGRRIQMYVYSLASDTVRLAVIAPRHNWGGDGVLGCDVGQGYLHCLPSGSTLTEGRTDRGEHLKKVCEPSFLRECGRSVPVTTPLGDGDCVLPFPGTEERIAPSGKKVVLLDWGFSPGELDVTALVDCSEVVEREVQAEEEVDLNGSEIEYESDDGYGSDYERRPKRPLKPSELFGQKVDPDEPPMLPAFKPANLFGSGNADVDAGAGTEEGDTDVDVNAVAKEDTVVAGVNSSGDTVSAVDSDVVVGPVASEGVTAAAKDTTDSSSGDIVPVTAVDASVADVSVGVDAIEV